MATSMSRGPGRRGRPNTSAPRIEDVPHGQTQQGDNNNGNASMENVQLHHKGRGSSFIVDIPSDEKDRIMLQLRPDKRDFVNGEAVTCISHLCMKNWPTTAITWSDTPQIHKNTTWEEFQKRFQWDPADQEAIGYLFSKKCSRLTTNNMSHERKRAMIAAAKDHPGEDASKYMRDYKPSWCTHEIWQGMCDKWNEEKWKEKGKIAKKNRASGVPEGAKPKATYRGGSISISAHVDKMTIERKRPVDFVEAYKATHNDLDIYERIAIEYERLFKEKYPPCTIPPSRGLDQELWEKVSVVKKNYVLGQGQRRRRTTAIAPYHNGSSSSSSQASNKQWASDLIDIISKDPSLASKIRALVKNSSAQDRVSQPREDHNPEDMDEDEVEE